MLGAWDSFESRVYESNCFISTASVGNYLYISISFQKPLNNKTHIKHHNAKDQGKKSFASMLHKDSGRVSYRNYQNSHEFSVEVYHRRMISPVLNFNTEFYCALKNS